MTIILPCARRLPLDSMQIPGNIALPRTRPIKNQTASAMENSRALHLYAPIHTCGAMLTSFHPVRVARNVKTQPVMVHRKPAHRLVACFVEARLQKKKAVLFCRSVQAYHPFTIRPLDIFALGIMQTFCSDFRALLPPFSKGSAAMVCAPFTDVTSAQRVVGIVSAFTGPSSARVEVNAEGAEAYFKKLSAAGGIRRRRGRKSFH
jgi:hypothetical protein